MHIFEPSSISGVREALVTLDRYYKDIRSLFEFVDIRFRVPEYGAKLVGFPKSEFLTNSSGFKLDDGSDYPYYLWTPSWIGRFYGAISSENDTHDAHEEKLVNVQVLSFIWIWNGSGDAYVEDKHAPECWIGVTRPRSNNREEALGGIARTIFNHFRIERFSEETENDGWIKGQFFENQIGCNLTGIWYVRVDLS